MRQLFLFTIFSAALLAGPVTISITGTFNVVSGDPFGPYLAEAPFSLSFQVDDPPTLFQVNTTTEFFLTKYTNAVWTIDGSPVAPTGNLVRFFGNGVPGNSPMMFCLDSTCDTSLEVGDDVMQPQFYSGSESSPTIVTGVYQVDSITAFEEGGDFVAPASSVVISAVGAATPEPSTALTGLMGLIPLTLLGRLRAKRKSRIAP